MHTSSTSPAPTKCPDEHVTEAVTPTEHAICIADTCCAPFRRTLCGREIHGDLMDGPESMAECVVCAHMAQVRRFCSQCGTECGG